MSTKLVDGVRVELTEAEELQQAQDSNIFEALPTSISMRQARLALHRSGLLANVIPTINAMTEPQKSEALIEWEYSQTVDRDWQLVTDLGASMGLTSEQLDGLFILAATL